MKQLETIRRRLLSSSQTGYPAWEGVFWKLNELLPGGTRKLELRLRQTFSLPLASRVSLWLLRGKTWRGNSVSLLVAGDRTPLSFWVERILASPEEEEYLGRFSTRSLQESLPRAAEQADYSIFRVHRSYAHSFRGLRMAEWLGSAALTEEFPARLKKSKSLKNDRRRAIRNSLSLTSSRDRDDFDDFYWNIYRAFMLGYFGADAVVYNYYRLRRELARGFLLLYSRNGKPRAGALVSRTGDEIARVVAMGYDPDCVAEGRPERRAAFFFLVYRHLLSSGFRKVRLGGVRPLLNDGLLQFKKKYGVHVFAKDDTLFNLHFSWRPGAPDLLDFLQRNPLVYFQGDRLEAVTVPNKTDPLSSQFRYLSVPGVRRVFVLGDDCESWPQPFRSVSREDLSQWPQRCAE